MRSNRVRCIVLTLMMSHAYPAIAQNKDCREIGAIARMARARTVAALHSERQSAGENYRAYLIFAIRQFDLRRNDSHAAEELLNLIPTDDNKQLVAMTFGNFLCEGESEADVKILSALGDRIAGEFSRAVLLVPQKMDAYVLYAAEAVQDPNSDYAIQMERVCRAQHRRFVRAVDNLGVGVPEKDHFATASSDWFRKHILDPAQCRALAIPEAD